MPDKDIDITEEESSQKKVKTKKAANETVAEVAEIEAGQTASEASNAVFEDVTETEINNVVSNYEPSIDFGEETKSFQQEQPQTEEPQAEETVTIQPVKFASFEDSSQAQGEANKNLDLLMDIKLQLTVELGRTELPIKKVLELTRGSIIELEKVAGEPVELYANGKLVAHGEVVVIEDNFGLRITSITEPEERIKGV